MVSDSPGPGDFARQTGAKLGLSAQDVQSLYEGQTLRVGVILLEIEMMNRSRS